MTSEDSTATTSTGTDDTDVDLIDYLLSVTPAERMRRHDSALQLVLALRKASFAHYGFDPRDAATANRGEG